MLKLGVLALTLAIVGSLPAHADEPSVNGIRFDDGVYGPSSGFILNTQTETRAPDPSLGQDTTDGAYASRFSYLGREFSGDVLILQTPRFHLSETWSVEVSRFSMKVPWEGYDYSVPVGSVHGYVVRFRHPLGANP